MMTPAPRRFEDIYEGEQASLRRVVRDTDVTAFVDLTGDNNVLHGDDEFARAVGFRSRVVHGFLIANYISTLLGTLLPGSGTLWLSQDLEFVRSVHIGDEITVAGKVKRISRGTRTLAILTQVYNQRGELVINGTARVKVLERKE
ncbi:MAG: MaoC family dehydratase [Candidatus Methylomirabilales bacterium]